MIFFHFLAIQTQKKSYLSQKTHTYTHKNHRFAKDPGSDSESEFFRHDLF